MKHQELLQKHSDFIWVIANLLRNPCWPPQYRRVMTPLTALRRLGCVLDVSKDKGLAGYKPLKPADKFDIRDVQAPKPTKEPVPDKEVA
ncbi:type I restriction-modification system subunit M N-terminal domain-containing protein [Stutzerimonas sp. NM35]